jgi:hypothetical protein
MQGVTYPLVPGAFRLSFLTCVFWLCCERLVLATTPLDPADQLQHVPSFALGGIGVAGTMSEGERALRALLHDSAATAQLEGLLTKATPAGQLYALLGLRVHDRAAYEKALKAFRVPNGEVETIAGCMIWRAPFKQILDRIKAGEYDHSLERSPG